MNTRSVTLEFLCWLAAWSFLLLASGCSSTPPANVDPDAWNQQVQEARIRGVRLAILAAEVHDKIDHETAVRLSGRADDVLNCVRKDPLCKLTELRNLNDPVERMKLVNQLMDRIEADLRAKQEAS